MTTATKPAVKSTGSKKELMEGSKAIAKSAIAAGCRFYASYPIQPNSHLIEAMAKELAKVGGVHINAESEGEAISMVWGAAVTGNRAMCSSTVTGMSLMHEAMSEMFAAEVPYVFVHMSRGQTEYRVGTRGGGHGEYRYIAFAPHTVQEAADLTRLAFYTAEKYRTPVLLQSDYILTHTVEPVEFKPFKEEGLVGRDKWAITGAKGRAARINSFIRGTYNADEKSSLGYGALQERGMERIAFLESSVKPMADTGYLDDSEMVVMAFGYVARFVKYAVNILRDEGLKIGYIRPITLWPFPNETVLQAAGKCK
ncbi:MAG: 3-methyl-2-oxobutanoate dehydrogenase subunit beta, partial [Chloroflexi bacterium]|nr:3-methyl-2-oxobutanoate dehydrogenase subunit beta [Chloroflexota bacterium]